MAEEIELTQADVVALCQEYMNPEHLAFVQKLMICGLCS